LTLTVISNKGKFCFLSLPLVHSFNSPMFSPREKEKEHIPWYSHRALPRAAGFLYRNRKKTVLLTVEPVSPHEQDLMLSLERFFSELLVLVACSRLQSHFHVGRAAHFTAAPNAAAYFKLLRYMNKRKKTD